MIELSCPTESETLAVARRLAALLRPGDVIILSGELGAGKTLFTGGIAAGLGVEEQVVSPSFVLLREYRSGFLPLFHADAYRLNTINEFDDLDLVDIAQDGVLVVEWGDAVVSDLPTDHLWIEFEVGGDGCRTIRVKPSGTLVDRPLEELM
jgi:tRNA threonylcarbamoyladenosine biosynthesis protein TsaE